MIDIYVLECEDGNVYVGKTTKGEKRLKLHINGRGAEWTKMHKPKRVMQYYTNATDADERYIFASEKVVHTGDADFILNDPKSANISSATTTTIDDEILNANRRPTKHIIGA